MVDLIREIDDTVLHAWMVSISALPIASRVPLGRIKKKRDVTTNLYSVEHNRDMISTKSSIIRVWGGITFRNVFHNLPSNFSFTVFIVLILFFSSRKRIRF